MTPCDKVRNIKSAEFGVVLEADDKNVKVAVNNLLSDAPIEREWRIQDVEPLNENELRLVTALVEAKKAKSDLTQALNEASSAHEKAKNDMLEYFLLTGAQSTKLYEGVGRVSTVEGEHKVIAFSITEDEREAAYAEIEAMGRGEIIKRTIHHKTLESFIDELITTGTKVPEHLHYKLEPKLSFAKKK